VNTLDLVIFDLDGTLVDTAPDIAAALAATLAEVAVPPPPLPVVKGLVGDGARALIARALAREGVERDVEPLLPRFLAHYADHLCVASRLYPGVGEALTALRGAGVAAAVVTNKPGDLARGLLAQLGIGADVRLARALGARAIAAGWGYVDQDRLRAESPDALADTPAEAARLLLG